VISFSERRRRHKGPYQSTESPLVTDSCFSPSMSSRGSDFVDIDRMFRSPLWTLWSFPCESLTCQPSPRGYIVRILQILWTFFTFSYRQPVREQRENWHSSTEVFPPLNKESNSKVYFPHMACHQKLFKNLIRFRRIFSGFETQFYANPYFL